jgi:hypothetical protein
VSNPSNTIITEFGILAYISADDLDEALQRLDGTLLVSRVNGAREVGYAGVSGDQSEDLPVYCAFTYDGRVPVS